MRAATLAKRKAVYRAARTRTPRRWTGDIRNWTPIGAIALKKRHPDTSNTREVLH